MEDYIESFTKVFDYFKKIDNNTALEKAIMWFDIKNPNLGGFRPLDLFKIGRGHKVLLFIKASEEGY